jgi:hypothetical protein
MSFLLCMSNQYLWNSTHFSRARGEVAHQAAPVPCGCETMGAAGSRVDGSPEKQPTVYIPELEEAIAKAEEQEAAERELLATQAGKVTYSPSRRQGSAIQISTKRKRWSPNMRKGPPTQMETWITHESSRVSPTRSTAHQAVPAPSFGVHAFASFAACVKGASAARAALANREDVMEAYSAAAKSSFDTAVLKCLALES